MERDFNEVAEIYDGVFKSFIRDHYLHKRVEFIKNLFEPGMRILDVGCGTGLLLNNLKNSGMDVYGLDNSIEMVSIASKNNDGKVYNGDALKKFPFPNEFFDGVIFIATAHHFGGRENFEIALANALIVLKNKGKILVWDHNKNNLYWYFLMKKVPQDTGKEQILSAKEILITFKKNNLINCKIYRKGFVPDFVNKRFFNIFKILEKKIEKISILNLFLAHNILIGEKDVEREKS